MGTQSDTWGGYQRSRLTIASDSLIMYHVEEMSSHWQGRLMAWANWASFRSRLCLNKITIRIILMVKYYSLTYSPKKKGISKRMSTGKRGKTVLLCDDRCPCLGLDLIP
ncbi:hypothetical protein TNCV_620321 [Trichonephila clavipes]|nr:hypothetical protein TNCV_620321 [Trichonephila clavipes]